MDTNLYFVTQTVNGLRRYLRDAEGRILVYEAKAQAEAMRDSRNEKAADRERWRLESMNGYTLQPMY